MTQKHYTRTVEIRTVRGTCDDCGATAGPAARDTLLGWGWTLSDGHDEHGPDRCPDCAALARARALRAEEDAARARLIRQLEDGEPLLVHGRVLTEHTVLYTRAEIDAEIARALRCVVDGGTAHREVNRVA